jgi:FkbM family methyltransferase
MNTISEFKYGKIIYNINDYYIGNSISQYGEYCDDEIKLINSLISKNDTILDVGANIGLMTIPFSKIVGPNGKVLSFEPQSNIYHILCGNVAINNLTNVECKNIALGQSNDDLFLPNIDYKTINNFGGVSLSNIGDIRIEQKKIDDLELINVNLIKIDVEGMELNVLNGATNTIEKFRPILYVENDKQKSSKPLIEFILNNDYNCYWHITLLFNINNFKHNPIDIFEDKFVSVNLICIPKERNLQLKLMKINSSDSWWKNI